MPIKIPIGLPALEILTNENIFVMDEDRAFHQDIRPLKIVLLNLMPTKIVTETQILRALSNSPLQTEVVFLHPKSYKSKNTPEEHLIKFYNTFDEIKDQKFDGMIITGAPVEHLDFEEVAYWDELKEILDWGAHNVTSSIYICWAAQAALYHYYGVPKYTLDKKMFGVYKQTLCKKNVTLFRGFDDYFYAPQSRHTEIRKEDIEKHSDLEVLATSDEAGVYIVATKNGRKFFITGHSEYDAVTLKTEYDRDKGQGRDIKVPKNYFPDDDPTKEPLLSWRAHSTLLFTNWLNYYVYQATPYELEKIAD